MPGEQVPFLVLQAGHRQHRVLRLFADHVDDVVDRDAAEHQELALGADHCSGDEVEVLEQARDVNAPPLGLDAAGASLSRTRADRLIRIVRQQARDLAERSRDTGRCDRR